MNLSWDQYFLAMLPVIAAKSKDRETKVGCLVVGPDHEIRSTGYNSLVRGLDDSKIERLNRPDKYIWIEHADRNALYNAARIGVSVKGCTMYLPFYPCIDCTKGIISSGISEVVICKETLAERKSYLKEVGRLSEATSDMIITETMFKECGVELRFA